MWSTVVTASRGNGAYLSRGRPGWEAHGMRLLMRTAAALTCFLLVTACGSEPRDTAGLVEPGFRTVLRVDLRPGTSGADSSALLQRYQRSDGVQEARGGDTDTLFIFSSDASANEIAAVRDALSDEPSVKQVNVQHRK